MLADMRRVFNTEKTLAGSHWSEYRFESCVNEAVATSQPTLPNPPDSLGRALSLLLQQPSQRLQKVFPSSYPQWL